MRPALRPNLLPGLGAALVALLALASTAVLGPIALVALAALVATLVLLEHPRVAAGLAIGLIVVVESQADWGPSALPARIYEPVPGAKIAPAEALLLLALVAALLHRHAAGLLPLAPSPLTAPLGLLALGLVVGVIMGRDAGAGGTAIVNAGRNALPVVLVPLILVQILETRAELRRALWIAGALATFKGVAGLAALATGLNAPSVGLRLTYFEAPANMTMLAFLCVALAAALTRAAPPRWLWWALPFVAGALLLSLRRSFWIAAVVGIVIVVVGALGRDGRRFAIPLAAVATVLLVVVLSSGTGQIAGGTSASGGNASLGSRIASINPTSISADRQDRYRLGERRNVLADLRASPLAGLGLGVPWRARYPVSIGSISREYVHFGALWWWTKAGMLGLVGYVWLLAGAFVASLAVWRHDADRLVRATGLGAAAAVAGYAVAELTATFAGPDIRSSIVLGAFLGLVAVARRQTLEHPPA